MIESGSKMHGIRGIYETHLSVADLERSVAFYRDIVGLELAAQFEERRVAFFWAGSKEVGMLGLWETGTAPLKMRLHIALRMDLEGVLKSVAMLQANDVQPLGLTGKPITEPVVIGWVPAAAVYFSDLDGHSIEFIHVLDEKPDHAFGVQPYSTWRSIRMGLDQ